MTRSWERALVTGASSGIGEAIARHLADAGTSVVLVARSRDALETLAAELPVDDVEVLAADLTDPEQRAEVEHRLSSPDAGAPIDLLVNNAGYGDGGPFATSDLDRQVGQVDLNVTALTRLTHAALPGMLARRQGSILNVSSIGGLQPTPGWAVYGATKAFVTMFSEALHEELRGTGVRVTAVLPGFTRTEFQTRAGAEQQGPSFLWQSAAACAAEALAGAAKGKPVVVTGVQNKVVAALTGPMPRGVKRRAAAIVAKRAT